MHRYLTVPAVQPTLTPTAQVVAYQPTGDPLPWHADVVKWLGPVLDQGPLGSCTAFASLQWFSALRCQAGYPWTEYSELADYYAERLMLGTVDRDSGATTYTALAVLEQLGAMPEADDPYVPANFRNPPPAADWDRSLRLMAQQAQLIPTDPHDPAVKRNAVRDALAHGHPCLMGFVVFPELEEPWVAQTGLLPMPRETQTSLGGHEVVIAGYEDAFYPLNAHGIWPGPGAFLVKNQWGTDWGWPPLKGYFWMPYAYFDAYTGDVIAGFPPPPATGKGHVA